MFLNVVILYDNESFVEIYFFELSLFWYELILVLFIIDDVEFHVLVKRV